MAVLKVQIKIARLIERLEMVQKRDDRMTRQTLTNIIN